ncbi:MAG: hypothetical protein WCC04_18515 [Terriglobales bacterium]
MATFEVAHLNIQNVNVVIIFLGSEFEHQTQQQQNAIQNGLQLCAENAGLAGNVVLVWQDSFQRIKFLAPPQQHAFFKTANYADLYSQVNKKLTCG